MAKVQNELDETVYNLGREIAFKNNLSLSKIKVSEMLYKIAYDFMKLSEEEDFEQITGLKKQKYGKFKTYSKRIKST